MFFSPRSRPHTRGGHKPESSRPCIRPLLETLEDRVTPSAVEVVPTAPTNAAALTSTTTTPSPVNFTFSPGRLIFTVGSTTIPITATLTDSSGAAINGGSVTFTVTSAHGAPVGDPVTATVSANGQVTANYTLPANLPMGVYTVTGVYNSPGSPDDGASGTAILDLVFGPIPPLHHPSSPPPPPSSAPQVQSVSQPSSPLALYQTAVTLYIDGVQLALDTLQHQPADGTQASIDTLLPGAGPWGHLFELAGELAVYRNMETSS